MNFAIYRLWSLQNPVYSPCHVGPPAFRDHIILLSGHFIQVLLYLFPGNMYE